MHILITGAAGFIGFHLSKLLLERGFSVVGVDSLTDYYDVNLKQARLDQLKGQAQFQFHKLDICDFDKLKALFIEHKFDYVVHLAAQVGVRYSLENPQAYIQTNLVGFGNMLELTRAYPPKHFVYASSSSVYGNQTEHAFLETDNTDHPVSHSVFNIGNSKAVQLLDFIQAIEKAAGKKAILNKSPMQAGDVTNTYADVSALQSATDYEPTTDVLTGVEQFVKWYQSFYL